MREILFRGERKDGNGWIYGSLWEDCGAYRILSPGNSVGYEVYPSTVGQYTGMRDKNGKRIFEGDICRVGDLLYKVEFKHSSWWFTILSNEVYCCPAFNSHCGECCKVVGTIHDDPGGALWA